MHESESLNRAYQRVVREQTGLDMEMGEDICAFDEIPDSGYHLPHTSRIFVDKVMRAHSRDVCLDHRAQESVWIPPTVALRDLDLEPNARKTVEVYCGML